MMNRNERTAELREAERLLYRAQCRVRCLEANLERIDPEDFETLMDSIEAAREEVQEAGLRAIQARATLCECEKKLSGTGNTGQP